MPAPMESRFAAPTLGSSKSKLRDSCRRTRATDFRTLKTLRWHQHTVKPKVKCYNRATAGHLKKDCKSRTNNNSTMTVMADNNEMLNKKNNGA